MRVIRIGLGAVVALSVTAGIGALSQVPYRAEGEAEAWIRLSWRISTPRIEKCRTLTAEELADLPVHMRREQVCDVTEMPYHIRIVLDGRVVEEALIRGAGARNDLPIYVYRELRVKPGAHRLEILLAPENGSEGAPESNEVSEPKGSGSLELTQQLDLAAGDVALVTRASDGHLVVRRSEQ